MLPDETIQLEQNFTYNDIHEIYVKYRRKKGSQILIDCAKVSTWKTAQMVFLVDLFRMLDKRRIAWQTNGVPENVQKGIHTLLYEKETRIRHSDRNFKLVDETLSTTVRMWRSSLTAIRLLEDIVFWSINGPWMRRGFRYSRTLYEITERGVNSLPIVALVSGIMGLILAMQAAAQLRNFGASIYIANLVGIAIIRELGPLLAAVLMAGRSGSAISAEIGSMVTTEEMDALRAMGVSITKYVVVPKFVALLIVLPCLALFADFIGVIGGYIFAVFQLGIPSAEYIDQTLGAIGLHDVIIGLTKSAADAIIIATVATHQGLTTTGGAEGIGKSTTKSVVHAIVFIAMAHLFFTGLFYFTGHTIQFK